MSTLLVLAYSNKVWLNAFKNLHSLRATAVDEESLAEVIAVIINHDLRKQEVNFVQKELNDLRIGVVK